MWRSSSGHILVFFGQENLEEVIMAQMEVVKRSPTDVKVRFFWHLDVHNFRLAGRWLYYGLYRMLVLTSGCVLLTSNRPVRRLGGVFPNHQSDDGVNKH